MCSKCESIIIVQGFIDIIRLLGLNSLLPSFQIINPARHRNTHKKHRHSCCTLTSPFSLLECSKTGCDKLHKNYPITRYPIPFSCLYKTDMSDLFQHEHEVSDMETSLESGNKDTVIYVRILILKIK